MRYEIKGETLPVVICYLEGGEKMITEGGGMSWMSPNMKMETTTNGGIGKAFGRMFSGEHIFQNIYTAQGGNGMIAFASCFPGSIKAFEIGPGREMVFQKSAFLASEAGVELSVFFNKKFSSGLFGGEGFIMQKVSGEGTVFAEFDGHVVEYELNAGQEIVIDTGHLAAMDASCRKYGEDQESTDGGVKRPENPAAVDRLGIRRISGRYGWIWNSGCHSGGNPLRTWIFTNPCDGCLSGSKCNTNGLRLCRNTDGNIGAAYGNITGKSCMGYNGAVITVNLNHTFCDGDH